MPKTTIGYYAVQIEHKPGIYMNWNEYNENETGVFFGNNDSRNLSERLPGECQTNNRAELYTSICALEIVDDEQDIVIFTDRKCEVRNLNPERSEATKSPSGSGV
ncbi:3263_t:CDS:2, partial [Gigaspora rosea]